MIGIIRMFREDQDEHSAGFKTLHDSFGPTGSRFDITGSDPTFDPGGLEMGTNRVRGRPIFARMAGWSELISKRGGKIRRQKNRNAHCSQFSRPSTKISTKAIGHRKGWQPGAFDTAWERMDA
jgi:hypothetical protein